jgi:hypothetical protein
VIGVDHWSIDMDGWTLVAVNAQLFGSGLAAEAAQWGWLEEQLGGRATDRRVALITHKPLAASDAELAAAPPYRYVPQAARRRIGDLRDVNAAVPLVVSGHVHQYRVLDLDGTRHVWAPTTWAVLPDEAQPPLGAKRCGIVSINLDRNTRTEPILIEPDGVAQLTITRDFPSPYAL